ncbi:MAG: copper amine oxidase N-terminal domain-containing protein [Oscillospiraceae bacterium]|nr:copper amine oxidase N-terminal domain-containing protein [Oscillospiraceae bacterium]
MKKNIAKKNILIAVSVLSVLTAQSAAFAQAVPPLAPVIINSGAATVPENTENNQISGSFIKTEITVNSTESDNGTVNLVMGSDIANNELKNAVISPDALIFDNTGEVLSANDIKEGAKLSLYTNMNTPMTLQLPVTYRPSVVIVETDKPGFVDVDLYNSEGINSKNTLQINNIEKPGELVVFYTDSSRSIPALITPSKVIFVGEGDAANNGPENEQVLGQYIKAEITVNSIESDNGTSNLVKGSDIASNELKNAIISPEALIFDNTGELLSINDIKEGAKLSLYTNVNTPMTLQLPVTYHPSVVIIETDKPGFVDVDLYNSEGINLKNTLQINTVENPGELVVFYTDSSRSIPALTAPSKVIFIGENIENNPSGERMANPKDLDYTDVTGIVVNGEDRYDNVITFNGNLMLPVRAICEKLGYTVTWDGELQAVKVSGADTEVSFTIGSNVYNVSNSEPMYLSVSPIIIAADGSNGLTYVPVELLDNVFDLTLVKDHGTLLIYNKQV